MKAESLLKLASASGRKEQGDVKVSRADAIFMCDMACDTKTGSSPTQESDEGTGAELDPPDKRDSPEPGVRARGQGPAGQRRTGAVEGFASQPLATGEPRRLKARPPGCLLPPASPCCSASSLALQPPVPFAKMAAPVAATGP